MHGFMDRFVSNCLKNYVKTHPLIFRYPIESLPPDELGYRQWLCQVWKDKEESLKEFHKKQSFPQVSKGNKI